MHLIVGLGNPGEKYENNRHNAGFLFIDYLIKNLQSQNSQLRPRASMGEANLKFKIDQYSKSEILRLDYDHNEIVIAKPQTFMNHSGRAVKHLTTNYQLLTTSLIIIHDDLDIPLGKFRIDLGRGPKLHNGITSIEQNLKTNNFWRVRIGVDNRPAYFETSVGSADRLIPGESYVLKNFHPEEKIILDELFPKIFARIQKEFLATLF